MAVTSLGGRGEECSLVTSVIGTNIQLKYLVKNGTKNHYSNDQVCPYKCPNHASDQWGALDAIEKGYGGKVTSHQFLISSMESIPVATILLVSEATGGVSSPLHPVESLLSSENVQRQDKGKWIANDEGKKVVQKRVVGDEDDAVDFRRVE
ncbi:hypothetical protein Fot_24491 [Forsythia ovata]|uniref:Uncharacterized protein n=1 Tax=Forsythia ovata TaxID=205694 RepID=A0ABD1U732_9LAMI